MEKLRLFGFSFLILFVELVLVRWITGNLRVFGYFANLVLIASFLGIGFGFLLSRYKFNLQLVFAPAIAALTVAVLYSKITVRAVQGAPGLLGIFSADTLRIESPAILVLIFCLIIIILGSLGQAAGRIFTKFRPLTAYSIDIAGSILGVVVFSLASFLSVSAFFWFISVFILFLVLVRKSRLIFTVSIIFFIATGLLLIKTEDKTAIWSPYSRITLKEGFYGSKNGVGVLVFINNILHQFIGRVVDGEEFYYYPYTLFDSKSYKNILIIGSGNGVDTAVALLSAKNIESIDAVEIDPKTVELGRKLNPDRPYSNPKVHVYIDDGRGFLERTDKKYDLIIYGETDSLVLVNSTTGVRLESFLYTTDAFRLIKNKLSDNGVFFMYSYYRDNWVIEKLAIMTEDVFGQAPYMVTEGDKIKFSTIVNGPKINQIDKSFAKLERFSSNTNYVLATDDWPFLYLTQKTVPVYYLKILGVLILISITTFLIALKRSSFKGLDHHYFIFGVGFMLLETKSLINFAQLFGTTWVVNSLVIIAILLFVLFANYVNYKFKLKKIGLLYAVLFITLLFQFVIPVSSFSFLGTIPRYIAASIFYLCPIFIANLIFSYRFKSAKNTSINFGINILGGAIGGFLEYSALIVGYRALALIIIFLYFLTLVGKKWSLTFGSIDPIHRH